jgi:hypothetical protein
VQVEGVVVMPVQLKGQSTWGAKRAEQLLEAAQRLWADHKLKPTDAIRFRKSPGSSTWVEGKPLDVAADGSITCSAGGRIRAVLPERLEVKITGPRGGTQWVPLIPDN